MGHTYIWQHSSWPENITWNDTALIQPLGTARKEQGYILAQARDIGLHSQAELIAEEAFSTSAIEGEVFDKNSIRSSVANHLGLQHAGTVKKDRHIDGLVEMLLDATHNFSTPLLCERLHGWHAGLFPTGHSGIHQIKTGAWRTGQDPMKVISGHFGKQTIHFEAPPSHRVSSDMDAFLYWWSNSPNHIDGLLRAGLAHFWFVTIHPYDDGNGRISRAITDMALAQDEQSGQRLYSLSSQIVRERQQYYDILEQTQKGNGDITSWLRWFLELVTRAIQESKNTIAKTLFVTQFWKEHQQTQFNDRQIKVLQKLLQAEPGGFEGGLTNRKYVSITKTSRESAKRDLLDLEQKGVLQKNPGAGRSQSYSLNTQIYK